jgi:hypothetical protein
MQAYFSVLNIDFPHLSVVNTAAPEAQLKGELAEAQQAVKAAEAKLAAAVKLKQKYKQQVGFCCFVCCLQYPGAL